MPPDNRHINFILSGIKQDLSANEIFRQMRGTDLGLRRATVLDLVRQLRDDLETRATGIDRPLDRKPYTSEILAMSTVTATGYLQHVDIWVQDQETGEIFSRPYSIRTDDLLTHGDAIETALDRAQDFEKLYGQKVLGATYLATYLLVPQGS